MPRRSVAVAFALLLGGMPAGYAASSAQSVAPRNYTVMGDASGRLTVRVTNNEAVKQVRQVDLKFNGDCTNSNRYDFSGGQVAPAGWSFVNPVGADLLKFKADTVGDYIAPGASREFTVQVTGNAGAAILPATADQTDVVGLLEVQFSDGSKDLLKCAQSQTPTWTRHSLALSAVADPTSAETGGSVRLEARVENRTSNITNLTGVNTASGYPASTPSGATFSAPSPSLPISLPPGENAVVAWTVSTLPAPSSVLKVKFEATGGRTSPEAFTESVYVGDLTANLSVSPVLAASGGTVDVEMLVTNHGTISLGDVRPDGDPASVGSASATRVSGPTPANVSSLPPAESAFFRWTYQVTGAAGTLYAVEGRAVANGPAASPLARSNDGEIAAFVTTPTPASIAPGDAGPIDLAVDNGTSSVTVDKEIVFTYPSTAWQLATAPAPTGWTSLIDNGVPQVKYTANGDTLAPGERLVFRHTYSAVPSPPDENDVDHLVRVSLKPNNGSPYFADTSVRVTSSRIVLSSSPAPATVNANGSDTLTLTANYTEGGLPVGSVSIRFEATAGTLSATSAVTDPAGNASVVLTATSSTTTVTGTATASRFTTTDTLDTTFTGITGPNLLYVGGTLYAREVAPGTGVAFEVWVENSGDADATLSTATTHFDFTCENTAAGTSSFQSFLASPQTVLAGETAALSFATQTVPADCVSSPEQVVDATFTYNPTRRISDRITLTASPTFAAVAGLSVESSGAGARLTWFTELEFDNVGFRVLRADGAGEPEYLDAWVPATGAAFGDYELFDPGPLAADVHAYWVEDVALDGLATRHGPVFLAGGYEVPDRIAAATMANSGHGVSGVWDDPSAPADIRILEEDATGITWEIVPPPFESTEVPWPVELRHRLRIPTYGVLQESGRPDLPVRHLLVPLPANASGRLTVREISETEHVGLRPTFWAGVAPPPEVLDEPSSTLRWNRHVQPAPGEPAWPERAVSLKDLGRAGNTRLASLVVTPLRWRAYDAVLEQATRLVVRMDFVADTPAVSTEVPDAARRQREIVRGPALVAKSTRAGLARVPLSALVASGLDPADVAVHRLGEAVASRIEGGELLFVTGAFESQWSREQSWWVAPRRGAPPSLALEPGVPPAAETTVNFATHRTHVERDTWFAPLTAQGSLDDRWFWTRVFTGGPSSAAVTLPVASADAGFPATLTVELSGLYDDPRVAGEHRVEIRLNGAFLGEVVLDAYERTRIELTAAPGLLVAGDNLLEMVNLSAALSHVGLDSVDVTSTALANAAGTDELAVAAVTDGVFTAGGFAEAPAWVVDETDPAAPRLLPFSTAFDGSAWTASVATTAGRRLRVITRGDAGSLAAWAAHDVRDALDRNAGADYLVIAASALVAEAQAFADYRATADGGAFRTAVVDVADVYDAVSFGDVDPEALRRFLQRASAEWPAPAPRYVLLVGDSDADPLDHLGLGTPPAMLLAPRLGTSVLEVPSDVLAAILDGDGLPDLAIGRIPARDAADVHAALDKTIAYESAPRDGWEKRQVLLADDDLPEFDALAAELEAFLPVGMTSTRLSASELGSAAARASFADGFADGAALVAYAGHGGVQAFGAESFLASEDVPFLGNDHYPVVFAADCMNAYFDHPYFDALSETLVRTPGAGAVAFFGSSAVTRDAGHRDISVAFHRAFWREPHLRLGDIAMQAGAAAAWRTDTQDLIGSFLLMGDPALKPNVNGTPFANASLVSVAAGKAWLSASGSHDPEGAPLAYRWEIVGRPEPSSEAWLTGADTANAVLVAPSPGRYRIRLTVADEHRASPPDELAVEIRQGSAPAEGDRPAFGCGVASSHAGAPPTAWLPVFLAGLGLFVRRLRRTT